MVSYFLDWWSHACLLTTIHWTIIVDVQELSTQCEGFIGHMGCGGTMLHYQYMVRINLSYLPTVPTTTNLIFSAVFGSCWQEGNLPSNIRPQKRPVSVTIILISCFSTSKGLYSWNKNLHDEFMTFITKKWFLAWIVSKTNSRMETCKW
jgi:hypothetical protein